MIKQKEATKALLLRFIAVGTAIGFILSAVYFFRFAPTFQTNDELLLAWDAEKTVQKKDWYILYLFERAKRQNDERYSRYLTPVALQAYARSGQTGPFFAILNSAVQDKDEAVFFIQFLKSWIDIFIQKQNTPAAKKVLALFLKANLPPEFSPILNHEAVRLFPEQYSPISP